MLVLCLQFFGIGIAQDYTNLIQQYLNANRTAVGVTEQDISEIEIVDQVFTKQTGVTHVYAAQRANGIEIYNAIGNFAIRNNTVIYFSNTLESNILGRVNTSNPGINGVEAATNAASELGLGTSNFVISNTISGQEFLLNTGGVSQEEVPVKLVYVQSDNELRLAWDLSILTLDGSAWHSVRVDAISGTIIDQNDWILTCNFGEAHEKIPTEAHRELHKTGFGFKQNETASMVAGEQYNVYAVPLENPLNGDRSIVTEPQDLVASPFGWHDTNGATGAEFTITRGNNVWAQEDINGNNGTGASPDGGADLIFDFPLDQSIDALNFTPAATVNLFYWNNIMHDVFYQYGFDEASGNFQENNYGNGGSASDFVFADAQDGAGTNNATFGTPPDGQNPGMTMFLWNTRPSDPSALIVENGSLAGDYDITEAQFGPGWPTAGISGDLALTLDNDTSGDPNDACDPLSNGAALNGTIAVIRRGSCDFVVKVLAAQNAGAIGVIIVNNAGTAPIDLGDNGNGGAVTIPSGMVSLADGEAIIAALENGDDINVTVEGGGGPNRIDGDLDNGVIAHEYGHGISNRLTGGRFNAGCLGGGNNGTEFGGMGEGWSDYFGLMVTMDADDTATQGRGIGNYVVNQPIAGPGIRPRRYSTSFAVNNLTYDDVSDNANISQPHGIGTIWATMIWDMTWALINEYGFDADIYNGNGGNNIALQLVMDGLKLQPCSPGFVDARDGVLAAIDINTDIDESDRDLVRCLAWNAFADRGLGFSASQGSAANRFDGVEAFDMPPVDILDCEGLLSTEDNTFENAFNVFPNPSNGQMTLNISGAFGEGQIRIFDINGRAVFNQDVTLQGSVNIDAGRLKTGVYIMNIVTGDSTFVTKLVIQ